MDITREPNSVLPWEDDSEYLSAWGRVKPHTLVGIRRCHILWQLARRAEGMPGAIAELGVYRGGTALLMALAAPSREIHLFDTFRGIPDMALREMGDRHRAGEFADTSVDEVLALLSQAPGGSKRTRIYPGVFPETAGAARDSRFALAHLDADIYQSMRAGCEFFWPRLVSGGVLVIDDYGFKACAGVKHAVNEYFEERGSVVVLPTGQAFAVRCH